MRESPEFLFLGAARVPSGQMSVGFTKKTLNWPEGETAPLENSGGWSALHVLSTGRATRGGRKGKGITARVTSRMREQEKNKDVLTSSLNTVQSPFMPP
jgi:hypothetical protein